MNEISFTIDMLPPTATAQQKGAFICGGKIRFFKKKKVKDAEDTLTALFYKHKPCAPMQGGLKLSVKWFYPYRKSEKKSITKTGSIVPHITRPDLDNLEKSLIDVLTRLQFWQDDSQVCVKETSKFWAPTGKISIKIERVDV